MEQKKILWIIAAVGVFMLVVLGAAGFIYSPSRSTIPAIASVSPVEKNNSGWKTPDSNSQPVSIPGDNSLKVNEMVVLADNTTVYEVAKTDSNTSTTIDLNALKQELSLGADVTPPESTTVQPQNINITVNVPETSSPVVVTPDASSTPVVTAKYETTGHKNYDNMVVKAKTDAEPEAKSKTVSVVKASNVKKSNSKADVKPAPKAEPKKTQFWVQVAAYSNKKGAEGARSVLDENKIPADIFTYKDNKDKLYYRVRVGPYTTKSEAEYWRTRIEKIETFAKAESYITSTEN